MQQSWEEAEEETLQPLFPLILTSYYYLQLVESKWKPEQILGDIDAKVHNRAELGEE